MLRYAPVALLLVALTTPLLAAGRELAPRELGESAYRESFLSIGAGAGGRFLTVWREERLGFGTHIMGSLSDAAGRRLSPSSFLVVPNANASEINVVGTGEGFTLFWGVSQNETYMTELDASGRVVGSRRLDVRPHFARDVAWNGTHFLMTFRYLAAPGRFAGDAVLLARDGEVLRAVAPLEGMVHANVEAFGDTFFAAVSGDGGLYGYRITAGGAATRMLLEPRRTGLTYQPLRALMADRGDGSLLLVWSGGDPDRSELLAAVLSASGEITRPRVVASRPAITRALVPLAMMRSGERFVLTFTDAATLGSMTLDRDGTLIEETAVPVTPGTTFTAAATNGAVTAVANGIQEIVRTEVVQRTVDGAGRISAPDVHSIAPARQRQPILGAGGGRFVAAWEEQTAINRVRLASLDASGEPRADRFLGGENELPTPGDLAWNGTEYLLAYVESRSIRAVRVDASGRLVDREPLILGSETTPGPLQLATAWAGNEWVVVWATYARAHLATISIGGIVRPRGELRLNAPLPEGLQRTLGSIAIAGDERRFLVAWTETQLDWCLSPICDIVRQDAWVARFRHDGTPLGPAVAVMENATRVALATSGEEYVLISGSEAETRATVIDGARLALLATRSFPAGLCDITWDGREYVLAQRHRSEWPGYLVVTRFDRELELTATPRGVLTLRSDEFAPPSIAAVMAGDALVAISEGEAASGSRAVVYAERDMQPMPDWPPPRRRAVR